VEEVGGVGGGGGGGAGEGEGAEGERGGGVIVAVACGVGRSVRLSLREGCTIRCSTASERCLIRIPAVRPDRRSLPVGLVPPHLVRSFVYSPIAPPDLLVIHRSFRAPHATRQNSNIPNLLNEETSP
jgi:hypothetical protein